MLRRIAMLSAASVTLLTALSACSYVFTIDAVMQDGQVVFLAQRDDRPLCLKDITIYKETAVPTGEKPLWSDAVIVPDGCANPFPIAYGAKLQGQPDPKNERVAAKPLQHGVVYEIHASTVGGGIGNGRFVIHGDGRVESLPREQN